MRIQLIIYCLMALVSTCLIGQTPHLDVEGHTKIRGNIDIHNALDSTSILIGAGAGDSLGFEETFDYFNTYVGVHAGQSNTNEFNSIFGALAGESSNGLSNSFFGTASGQESSGNANSFFGGASGQNNTGHENAFFGIGAGANNAANNNSFFGSFSGGLNEGGTHNSFFGSNSGLSNFTGNDNSFFGFEAGLESGGDNNSFFGSQAAKNNNSGNNNSFFGAQAGKNNNSGNSNSFFGRDAGFSTTSGSDNAFFGAQAGMNNTTGLENAFFGYRAGEDNVDGEDNTYIGFAAGSKSNGSNNVYVGRASGVRSLEANNNAFFGASSGFNNATGENNTFIGGSAGGSNKFGSYNTFLGNGTGPLSLDSVDRAIAIGYNAKVACSNCAVIGGTGEDAVKVAIGTSQPDRELTISDVDENGDAVISLKASNSSSREMILGVNQSSGGILSMQTNNDLFFRTNGTNRMVIENDGKVGIGTTAPTEKLDVDGNVRFRQVPTLPVLTDGSERVLYINTDGTLVRATSGTISDRRLKEDIKELQGALDQVTKLSGYSYYFKSDSSQTRQIGVMAQELERAYPELVIEDPDSGYKRVQYPQLTAVLIQAIKEQQQQIEMLQEKVQALENQDE